jgi:hypothetical protein
MQSTGHGKKAFAAKPMLRIVNMQKRLRPVYPGLGATDFAMELRDRHLLDPPPDKWFKLDANEFRI